MRFTLSLAVLGLLLAGSVPALAQNAQQTQPQTNYYGGTPMYNTGTGVPYYNAQPNGAAPVYNNGTNVPSLPLQQMVAGQNAPSYNYGGKTQPYNFGATNGTDPNGIPMSQVQGGAFQRDLGAQAYQQQYMQNLQQMQQQMQQQQQAQGQPQNGSSLYQGNQFSQLYANATGQQKPPAPTKKHVVYKEMNNPLVEPPRLFSLDQ